MVKTCCVRLSPPIRFSICLLTKVFAKARLLEAPKRRSHVRLVVGVDEYRSSLQSLAHVHRLVDVPGEHARGQAVLGVVGSLQHAVHIAVVRGKSGQEDTVGAQVVRQHCSWVLVP